MQRCDVPAAFCKPAHDECVHCAVAEKAAIHENGDTFRVCGPDEIGDDRTGRIPEVIGPSSNTRLLQSRPQQVDCETCRPTRLACVTEEALGERSTGHHFVHFALLKSNPTIWGRLG